MFANASKIIRNWFLTLQPDNYLQFTKVGTRKGMDVIWALDASTCLCTNLCPYLFMHLCERKKSFIKNLYTNFISEVIDIDFWQIWHFDGKGTGWVGLELSIILTRTVERFDMWVTPYTGILILAKLKYFVSKDLRTKTL